MVEGREQLQQIKKGERMKKSKFNLYTIILLLLTLTLFINFSDNSNLCANEKSTPKTKDSSTDKTTNTKNTELTKKTRENTAQMYEQMAKCLRSNKSLSSCRNEMKVYYKKNIDKDWNSMMERKDWPQNREDNDWCPMMHHYNYMHGNGKMMGN